MLMISPLGQQLFFATKSVKHGVVTLEYFKNLALCGENTLKVIVSRLLKKGALLKLKNGVYSWNVEGNGIEDFFYASQAIYGGYLGFSTALYLHKLSDNYPFTIFVATRSQSASKNIGQVEVKAVSLHGRALGIQQLGSYTVSTVPKTIYDCFHLPEYAGGYSSILQAVYLAKMDKLQWLEFLNYVEKFGKLPYKKKVCQFLNLLNETDRPVPKWVLSALGKPANRKLNKKELLHWWYV